MQITNTVRVWIKHPYESGNFNGTAFFIENNTLLTAKHVVLDREGNIYSEIYLNDTPDGGIILIDEVVLCERDIAILKIKRGFSIPEISFTSNLNIGSEVQIYGFHDKDGIRNVKVHNISGYINKTHTYELQSHLSGGFSGSPVLLDGKLCGVTQAINSEKNITYIIPIEENCYEFIDNNINKDKLTMNIDSILDLPTGIVPLHSNHYVKREEDERCYENLLEQYTLIKIKAPIRYGKTSLLYRLMTKAKEKKYHIILFEFQKFDELVLFNLNTLLELIHENILEELKVEVLVNPRILKRLPAKEKATRYMEEILLKLDKPLLLVIDETNKLFKYSDVSDSFFGLIRAWHEEAKRNVLWENLKIILAHSIDPELTIENINQSPFNNVGLRIKLEPFNKEELKKLSLEHGIVLDDKELNRFMSFIGGHPFLSRKVLYTMAKEKQTLKQIIDNAYGSKTIFDDFSIYIRIIQNNKSLMKTLKKILKDEICNNYKNCDELEAMGLIRYNLNKPEFFCELYRDFFHKILR